MRVWRLVMPVALVLVLAAGDCAGGGEGGGNAGGQAPPAVRATPAGAFAQGADSATGEEVTTYVAGLEFDTSAIASDAQYFYAEIARRLVRGPYMRIAPEIGVLALTEAEAEAGRVIARVSVQAGVAPGEPVAHLYIYAHKIGPQWRTSLLAPGGGVVAGPMDMEVHPHGTYGSTRPRAVWIVRPMITLLPTWCVSCSERIGWCGRPQPVQLWYDVRTWAYLRGRLGGSMWPGFPGTPTP